MSAVQAAVFGPAFESLGRSFRIDVATQEKLLALGVDLHAPQVAYPVETFVAALDLVGQTLAGVNTPQERFRLLGRAFVKGWVGTKIGVATVTIGKLLGPKRLLMRMDKNFRTSANYVETVVTEQPPRGLELLVKTGEAYVPLLPPDVGRLIDYRHGLLEGVLAEFGVKKNQVDIVERDDARVMARYVVRW